MFATSSLAHRIERAEVELVASAAAASAHRVPESQMINRRLAGGIAVFVEEGCPFNKVAGLGFEGVPTDADLDEIEGAFATRGAPLQVEVSSLGDPDVVRQLTRRQYELVGSENVLGLDLRTWQPFSDTAGEIDVQRAQDSEGKTWLATVTDGFLHPDVFDGPPSHESFPRESLERIFDDSLRAIGMERYLARRGGVVAGGASLRVTDGVALLCGASTLPDHRRRGVQRALLGERLRSAAARGCDMAIVTTQPASKSQANVERVGFALLYVRAVLVKNPPAVAAPQA
jgi:GNAT superfamily N-acetyltransferase